MINDSVLIALIYLSVMGGILGGGLYADSISCDSQWRDSGFGHRWSVMGGCQIKFQDGTWIPANNYRGG